MEFKVHETIFGIIFIMHKCQVPMDLFENSSLVQFINVKNL